jgi:hypothetical protein
MRGGCIQRESDVILISYLFFYLLKQEARNIFLIIVTHLSMTERLHFPALKGIEPIHQIFLIFPRE